MIVLVALWDRKLAVGLAAFFTVLYSAMNSEHFVAWKASMQKDGSLSTPSNTEQVVEGFSEAVSYYLPVLLPAAALFTVAGVLMRVRKSGDNSIPDTREQTPDVDIEFMLKQERGEIAANESP